MGPPSVTPVPGRPGFLAGSPTTSHAALSPSGESADARPWRQRPASGAAVVQAYPRPPIPPLAQERWLHACSPRAPLQTCPSDSMAFCLSLLDGDQSADGQEQSYVGKRSNRVVRTLQNSKCRMSWPRAPQGGGQPGPACSSAALVF